MPIRWASTARSAATPTSSTCWAGARWRCPPAAPPPGCRFPSPSSAQAAHDVALLDLGRRWEGHAPGPTTTAKPRSQPTLPLVVVGAHLAGLPLNHQLIERGACLRERTLTAPAYRLYALPGTTPPKPGLVRVKAQSAGSAIEVELWDMPAEHARQLPGRHSGTAVPGLDRAGRRRARPRLPVRSPCRHVGATTSATSAAGGPTSQSL